MTTTATPTPDPVKAKPMTEAEADRLVRRIEIMTSGLTGELGIHIAPSLDGNWAADSKNRILYYDLGLAARLSNVARTGVIAHEIGHLRFTKTPRFPKAVKADPRDHKWAHFLFNVFEDRRIELLMVDEFPGLEPGIAKLRAAFTARNVAEVIAKAPPHFQFLNGLYSIIFGDTPMASHPEVLAALAKHHDEALRAIVDTSTSAMVRRLIGKDEVEANSIYETLIRFRDMKGEDKVQRVPESTPPPEAEADEGNVDEGLDLPDPGEGEGDDPLDAPLDEGSTAESDAGGSEGPDVDSGLGLPDPADHDGSYGADEDGDEDEDGEAIGPTPPTPEQVAEDEENEQHEGVLPDSGDVIEGDDEDEDKSEADPDDEDWRAMTPEQREILDEALREAEDNAIDQEEADDARRLLDQQDVARGDLNTARKAIDTIMRSRGQTDDDRKYDLPDDPDDYDWEVWPIIKDRAAVLGRDLDSILAENRMDRYSAIGYKSGARIHTRKLASAGLGSEAIFRRKGAMKNRQFAVTLVCDVSGSMGQGKNSKVHNATLATALLAETFEWVQGSELAVYAFACNNACLKPFDRTLDQRRGRIAPLRDRLPKDGTSGGYNDCVLGGSTALSDAMARAGADMTARFDHRWQKMMIVVTDGGPNDREATKAVRTELEKKRGVECFAVGINASAARLGELFPHYVDIQDARNLPTVLVKAMRKRVRKA